MLLQEIKIGPSQDVKGAIKQWLLQNQINKAVIVNGIGSMKDLVFSVPSKMSVPVEIEMNKVQGPGEVVSITGEIIDVSELNPELAKLYPQSDDKWFIHIHAAIAEKGGTVKGGGMREGQSFLGLTLWLLTF